MSDYLSKKIKILSLWAMFMVVVVHAYCLTQRYLQPGSMVQDDLTVNAFLQLFLSNGLARFGVPLFFLVSGYLNYPRPDAAYGATIRKRFRTLILPYLLWSAVGLLLYWLVQHDDLLWRATQKAALGSFSEIKVQDFTWSQLLYRWVIEPIPFQLWFLRCLFFYALLTPLFVRVLAWKPAILLGFFSLMWLTNIGLYFVEGEGLLFFSLGLWLRHYNIDVERTPPWLRWWPAAGIWLCLLLLKTGLAFGPYEGFLPALQVLLYRLCEPLGVLVIWFGYDQLFKNQRPGSGWLGLTRFTFILYGMHVPLLHLMNEGLFLTYGETDITRGWVFPLVIVAVTVICVLTGMLLRRFALPLFGVLTGGRGV